jgi:hypothetical protein
MSFPPPPGAMNPYPFVALNHLTVPAGMNRFLDTHAQEKVRDTGKETSSSDLRGRGFD